MSNLINLDAVRRASAQRRRPAISTPIMILICGWAIVAIGLAALALEPVTR